jgi:hypothetical protein
VVAAGGVDEEEEATEVTVVGVTDAVVRPWTCTDTKGSVEKEREKREEEKRQQTVMIHLQHTAAALSTVVSSWRLVGCAKTLRSGSTSDNGGKSRGKTHLDTSDKT